MERAALKRAQESLGQRLKALFGSDLPGVAGFGAGLDRSSGTVRLKVALDNRASAERARAQLPDEIEGLGVDVEERRAVRGDS